ncbi:MarR family transcriptional regulator [Candidatus Hodarchaeum mangrovi]
MLKIDQPKSELDESYSTNIGIFTLPRSAQIVFTILSQEGPLTSGDLERKCSYSDRTIRNALKRLIKFGLVKKVANFSDMRTSLFKVHSNNAA